MKKYFLFVVLSFISNFLIAIDLPTYIINLNKDTLHGQIELDRFMGGLSLSFGFGDAPLYKLHYSISFREKNAPKAKIYEPKDLLGFVAITEKNDTLHYVSLPSLGNAKKSFFYLIEKKCDSIDVLSIKEQIDYYGGGHSSSRIATYYFIRPTNGKPLFLYDSRNRKDTVQKFYAELMGADAEFLKSIEGKSFKDKFDILKTFCK
jgi:hypothetical protein